MESKTSSQRDFYHYRDIYRIMEKSENEFESNPSFKTRERYITYLNLFSKIPNDLLNYFPITKKEVSNKIELTDKLKI